MMPFKSKAQQRFMYSNKPEMAKEFSEHMSKSDYKKMPMHKGKKSARDMARMKKGM